MTFSHHIEGLSDRLDIKCGHCERDVGVREHGVKESAEVFDGMMKGIVWRKVRG
jgi:hypothetical protein